MLVSVIGPNLRDQSRGDMHVHATGCGDIARQAHRDPEFKHPWDIEADSIRDIVLATYDPDEFDFDPDDAAEYSTYRAEFYVAPCVKLPE